MTQINRGSGFTLIELMVVIAVVSILLTVGVPSFASLIERHVLPALLTAAMPHEYIPPIYQEERMININLDQLGMHTGVD